MVIFKITVILGSYIKGLCQIAKWLITRWMEMNLLGKFLYACSNVDVGCADMNSAVSYLSDMTRHY